MMMKTTKMRRKMTGNMKKTPKLENIKGTKPRKLTELTK